MGNTGLSRRNSVFFSNKQDSSTSDKNDKHMISSRQSTLHEDEELLLAAKNAPPPEPLTERQKHLLCETWTILEKDIASVGVITFISGNGWRNVTVVLLSLLTLIYTLNLMYSVTLMFIYNVDQKYMPWHYIPLFLRAGWCNEFCSMEGPIRGIGPWCVGLVLLILIHCHLLYGAIKEMWGIISWYIFFGTLISISLFLIVLLSVVILLSPSPIQVPQLKSELIEWTIIFVFFCILAVYLMLFVSMYKFKEARIEEGFYAHPSWI